MKIPSYIQKTFPILALMLMGLPLIASACPTLYYSPWEMGYWANFGPNDAGDLAMILMVYSGLMIFPTLITYAISKKFNNRLNGSFGWTYIGTWSGGMMFLFLFVMLLEMFYPIFEIIPPNVFFLLWVFGGAIAGGFMGYSFMSKMKNAESSESPE